MGEHIRAGDLDVWVEPQGTGPDVLLIAGLGDPAEAWQFQSDGLADRYRLIAFDNRGTGRTPFSVATMADDAAALLQALGVPAAHVAGFSGGSAIAQELALRHPALVRSLVLTSTWARAGHRPVQQTRPLSRKIPCTTRPAASRVSARCRRP